MCYLIKKQLVHNNRADTQKITPNTYAHIITSIVRHESHKHRHVSNSTSHNTISNFEEALNKACYKR